MQRLSETLIANDVLHAASKDELQDLQVRVAELLDHNSTLMTDHFDTLEVRADRAIRLWLDTDKPYVDVPLSRNSNVSYHPQQVERSPIYQGIVATLVRRHKVKIVPMFFGVAEHVTGIEPTFLRIEQDFSDTDQEANAPEARRA